MSGWIGVLEGGGAGGEKYVFSYFSADAGAGAGFGGLSATDLTELVALAVVVAGRRRSLRSLQGDG